MRLSIHNFVVASVLAHAALLAVWAGTPSQRLKIPASLASAPTLHIALLQQGHKTRKHAHTRHTKPSLHHPHPRRHSSITPRQRAQAPVNPVARSMPATSKPTNTVAHPYQAELRREQIRNRVLSRIRTDLQQYFVYPLLAQRQGWQGRVLLGFSVAANGEIHNIHVASGSGYAILDTSAVSALAHIHHLYETGSWLHGKPLELQLPVVFQLQGG